MLFLKLSRLDIVIGCVIALLTSIGVAIVGAVITANITVFIK